MRKVKSTALLGAFVAVASLGVISHEAHGTTTLTSIQNTIAREDLPNIVAIPAPTLTAGVNYPSSATLKLTLSGGAAFLGSYTIGNGASCTAAASSATNTLSFSGCSITASASYPIESLGATAPNNFSVTVPSQGTNLIVLSYSSNVANDNQSSVTLATVFQQLTVTPNNAVTVYTDPSSLSTFITSPSYSNCPIDFPTYVYGACGKTAYNSIMISTSTGLSISIVSDTLNVTFNGIPSSVSVVATDFSSHYNNPNPNYSDTASVNYTQGTNSATVSLTLPTAGAVFTSPYSDTTAFYFINSGNIQPGTIYISSIQGAAGIYSYFSGSQNFLTFAPAGTQLYIPDALAPSGSNVIQSGYITISMPTSASIASVTVLNNSSASCPVPSLIPEQNNGMNTGVYLIDLGALAGQCTGLTPGAWQTGVPLVIFISGSNATPNYITADAYATFFGHLKRIPVNVLNASSGSANFSY
jgi:hypothetical protein